MSALPQPLMDEAVLPVGAQYTASCRSLGTHCNSKLVQSLSTIQNAASLGDIKHLDFSSNLFGRRGIRPVLQSILRRCHNIESLNLADNYLSNENVAELYACLVGSPEEAPMCTRLQYLDVSNNPISSPSGKLLSRLVDQRPGLRVVHVNGTLMNRGLAALIQGKCARKSPRFDGLTVLSSVAEGLRCSGLPQVGDRQADDQQPRSADAAAVSTDASGPVQSSASAHIKGQTSAKSADGTSAETAPSEWSAMETIWNLAAVAAPPQDGWTGLAAVMALVRQDVSIASMY